MSLVTTCINNERASHGHTLTRSWQETHWSLLWMDLCALSPEDHREQDNCVPAHTLTDTHTHTHTHLQCQLLTSFVTSGRAKRIEDKVSYSTSSVIQNNS